MNRFKRLLIMAGCMALTACAGLPPYEPAEPTFALQDTASTPLARIAAASRPTNETDPSGFRLLPTGESAFSARTALAAHATRSIDAQYYDIHPDAAGKAFLRSLRDAAQRGVRIRLLVDDFYAAAVYELLRGLGAHDGVQVRLFNPLVVRNGSPLMRMALSWPELARVNHRMHNKLFIADNALAVYGGRNIGDDYFMRHGEANLVDLDVLSTGQVVRDLSQAFDLYWNSEHVRSLQQVIGSQTDLAAARRTFAREVDAVSADQRAEPPLDALGQSSVTAQLAQGRLSLHHGSAQVFADPPTKVTDPVVLQRPSAAMRGQLQVIAGAKSDVAISSPYFLPSSLGMGLMRDARQRGIQTLVLTNSLGSTDEPMAHAGYSRYRMDMLRMGIELYEFGPDLARASGRFGQFGDSIGRLHAKLAVVDRRWLLVGSVNLDARSALFNTELGVSIDCPPVAMAALRVLAGDGFRSMYRLRLTNHGQGIEWVTVDADGQTTATPDEPHDHWLARWRIWFTSLLVGEEFL